MFKTIAGALLALFLCQVSACQPAFAHDDDHQMGISDPEVRAWYSRLMQPDNPTISCCGLADAWWADAYGCYGDECYAEITDTRDDAQLGRRHIPVGTRFIIPPHKYKWDEGNPTGHVVIFIGPADNVLCYVQGGGV